MKITRTPFRISFFGGGTDYPEWFMEHGGAVLATSIDKYCYVGLNNGQTWASFDIPPKSGMGTSSAYTVGLLRAFTDHDNKTIAQLATIIERDKLAGNIGYQDQYLCAVGGFHLLRFYASGIVDEPVENVGALNDYLLLVDTGQYRQAGKIIASQLAQIGRNEKTLKELMSMAIEGKAMIEKGDYRAFGESLQAAWRLKKELADNVTTPLVDDIYNTAIKAGAISGKLLGAGGGGFMLFFVEMEKREQVKKVLKGFVHVPFNFESEGSQIILNGSP